jgi:hypothetical protein
MLFLRRGVLGPAALLACWFSAAPLNGAVVGSIAGSVTDENGLPQIGATVTLLGTDGRMLQRVFTNQNGAFLIDNLFPGLYGVRVSVPSFLPAIREKIRVDPGNRSHLAVQLANLFTSIQLVFPGDGPVRDMTEDWKWVLRTASATRPVLRLTTPWEEKERQDVLRKFHGALGDVRGLLRVSAGDGGRISGLGTESDLGTAFALATSLFGNNNVLVSGNLGYGATRGTPTAGFHTTFSREMANGAQPEVSVTVRQLYRPVEAGRTLFGPLNSHNTTVLQTFTLGFHDHVTLGDLVQFEYGFLYDSVSFLDRLNYVSPFGNLSYRLDEDTQLFLRYAGGMPRSDTASGDSALGQNLSALALYPRMSVQRGRPTLQRGEHFEVGFRQDFGAAGVLEAAAYRDSFSNAAVTAIAPAGLYTNGDLLPDLFSNTSSFNAGKYETTGYRVSFARRLADHLQASLAYGLTGVLTPGDSDSLSTYDPNELRSILKPGAQHSVSAQLIAQLPQSRTWISSAYQWGNRRAVTAPDLFNASSTRSMPGLNVAVRQPLPQADYMPGKFEATAEFRNLLADGYVPLRTSDGRTLYLIQSVRSLRGGVNFIF